MFKALATPVAGAFLSSKQFKLFGYLVELFIKHITGDDLHTPFGYRFNQLLGVAGFIVTDAVVVGVRLYFRGLGIAVYPEIGTTGLAVNRER